MTSVTRNSKYNTAIRFFFLAAACMILLPLYTYGEAKNGEQPHVSDVSVHKKVLKTIIVDNYSPYTFVNQSGDPDGFSVDLIKAVAEEMGLALKIHVDTWAPARNALKDGNIDVLPMMAYSKERDEQFDFSVPHTIAYDAFFTRKDAGRIRSLDDLRGKKIIVMKGDQAHDYLLSTGTIGPEQLIFINSLPDALRLLSSGKGDAALMPKLVGLIVVKNLKLSNLELSPIVIEAYNRPFSFAVTEGN
jgi:polar amino acid transport system substrate-binding protein